MAERVRETAEERHERFLDELANARVTINRLRGLLVDLHRAQHALDDIHDRLDIHTAADSPLIYDLVSKAQMKRDLAVRALMRCNILKCDDCGGGDEQGATER